MPYPCVDGRPLLVLLLALTAAACSQAAPPEGAPPASGGARADEPGLACTALGCEGADDEAMDDTSLLQTGLQRSGALVGSGVLSGARRGPEEAKRSANNSVSVSLQATEASTRLDAVLLLSQESLRLLTASLNLDSEGSTYMIWVVLAVLLFAAAILALLTWLPAEEGPSGGQLLDAPEAAVVASMRPKEEPRPSVLPRHNALPRPSVLPTPPPGSGYLPPTAGMPTAIPVELDPRDGPPPICASLILPNTEARFMISMESLLSITTGSLDVLGTSGRKLLHASIDDLPDGSRSLALASDGCEGDPRVVISAPAARGGEPVHSLLVFGRGGRAYGSVEATSGGGAILRYQGVPVLRLEPGPAADLAMRAVSTGGHELGLAGRGVVERKRGGDTFYWGLTVKPGADAVLITCCMLATLLMVPSPARLSLPSLQPRPSALSGRSLGPSTLPSFARISTAGPPGR